MKETQFIVAVFTCACLAGIAEASKYSFDIRNKMIREILYITGFFGLWYCYAIATTGIDYTAYLREFQILSRVPISNLISSGFEIGYLLLVKVLAFIGADAKSAFVIIRTIIVFDVAVAIWTLQKEINIFYAVIAYICILFFDGYHIIMMFSASLILMGVSLTLRKKDKVGIVFCCFAAAIHYSAILFLTLFIIIYILKIKNIQMTRWWPLWVLALGTGLCAGKLVPAVVMKFFFLTKYRKYIVAAGMSFGVAQIVYYSLPVWLMIKIREAEIKNDWKTIFYYLIPAGFCVAYMGYSFGIFDRMFEFFSSIFILFLPYGIHQIEYGRIAGTILNKELSRGIWYVIFLIYFIFRAYIFISGHPIGYEFGPLQGLFS